MCCEPARSTRIWWPALLIACMLIGLTAYLHQLALGLQLTGLSRHMSWGAYIAQFTFLVGVAASALVLMLPAYVHKAKPFAQAAVFGEGLAVAATCMCLLCLFVDLGRPQQMLNIILHPSPRSLMFWDMLALTAYLLVNLILLRASWVTEHQLLACPPPFWLLPLRLAAVVLAVSVHVVTALLYAGLPGRSSWLTAILAARFLASAFASGPAVLLLFLLVVRRVTGYDAVTPVRSGLRLWIVYALACTVLFFGLEVFTGMYSNIPALRQPLDRLFASPLLWAAGPAALSGLILLIVPGLSDRPYMFPGTLLLVLAAIWTDKGPLLLAGGFALDAFGSPVSYMPTATELAVLLGIHATGLLILTLLWRPFIFFRKNSQLASKNTL